ESNGSGPEMSPGAGQYTPLFRRVAALNAAVVVGACVVTILVLSPGKLHSFAASEALVLAGSLLLVVVINLVLLRRALGPLVALTERFAQGGGLTVSRNLDRELPPLSEEAELVIYRVAQEALTNVARHAGTDRAEVSLTAADGRLTLRVLDQGKGFDPQRTEGGGMRGMRERAVLVGAQLAVTRRPRGGTEVRLSVPVEAASE